MRFNSQVECYVSRLSYDFESRSGELHIGETSSTDMRGCVELFKAVDPEVVEIRTYRAGEKPDTSYHLERGKWTARKASAAQGA